MNDFIDFKFIFNYLKIFLFNLLSMQFFMDKLRFILILPLRIMIVYPNHILNNCLFVKYPIIFAFSNDIHYFFLFNLHSFYFYFRVLLK